MPTTCSIHEISDEALILSAEEVSISDSFKKQLLVLN